MDVDAPAPVPVPVDEPVPLVLPVEVLPVDPPGVLVPEPVGWPGLEEPVAVVDVPSAGAWVKPVADVFDDVGVVEVPAWVVAVPPAGVAVLSPGALGLTPPLVPSEAPPVGRGLTLVVAVKVVPACASAGLLDDVCDPAAAVPESARDGRTISGEEIAGELWSELDAGAGLYAGADWRTGATAAVCTRT